MILLSSYFLLSFYFLSISAQTCTTYTNTVLGSGNIAALGSSSPQDCCNKCYANGQCVSWTYEPDPATCYLKDNVNSNTTKSGATSGLAPPRPPTPQPSPTPHPPTPPPPPPTPSPPPSTFIIEVETSKIINEVDPFGYRSVTIDTTTNRQFFILNWSDPNIMYLMKELGPMYVRVGGSGGDQNTLRFNGTNCSQPYNVCIDPPLFDQIYAIVVTNAKSRIIWGLQYTKYPNNTWDYSHGQEDFMKYCSSGGYEIYGFQLGNEQQAQVDQHPDIYASDFGTLNMLVTKYWPDPTIRPKIFGPDDQNGPVWGLQEFLMQVQIQNVPMYGITSHEYYGMNNDAMIDPSRLDSNFHTAYNWTGTLNQYFGVDRKIQMVADEIGPSIGGSGDCTDNYHRFNVFADGFWYLDSLGAHAQAGYQIFCRQDFYGIDYAVLDCAGHFPVPDYYLGYVWSLTVGPHVFNTTRPITKPAGLIRPYAHCSSQYPGGLTIMIVNINSVAVRTQVQLTQGSLGTTREDYLMTAPPPVNGTYPDGIYGKRVQLNGVTLEFTVGGQLPTIKPVQSTASDKSFIDMPEYSYGYFVYPNANLALCKSLFGTSRWEF